MKTKKLLRILCVIALFYTIGGIIYNCLPIKKEIEKKNKTNNVTIKDFNYIMKDENPEVYKKEFIKLKNNLESKQIDYKEYAKSISKLFIIDLYSLNAKKNMYDIGGTQYIYPDAIENYKLNAQNTLYKYLEDNIDNNRTQELPEVKSTKIVDINETTYLLNETNYDGYKVNLSINYNKDLGYDKKAEIIIIKSDKYLYIVEKN